MQNPSVIYFIKPLEFIIKVFINFYRHEFVLGIICIYQSIGILNIVLGVFLYWICKLLTLVIYKNFIK